MLDLETRIRSAQNKVDTLNAIALPAEDYDCPKCKNRQVIYYAHQEPAYAGGFYARDCAAGTLAASRYGNVDVTGVVRRGNVYGTQFHPEKSGDTGLRLLRAFAEL